MTKRRFLNGLIVLAISFTMAFASASCNSGYTSDKYSLTVLSTNDIHGRIETFAAYETIVKKVRKEEKNVVLLDAGDVFKRGTYESYQGKIEMEIENTMEYDAMVLGNNEFKVPGSIKSVDGCGTIKESESQISNIVKWAEFPILCGNVKSSKTHKYIENTEPYTILNVNGLKIGIIGVTATAPKDQGLELTKNKDFVSGQKAVKQLLPRVKKVSDIQLVLSHAGIEMDRQIKGVSAIIGGHDHVVTDPPEDSDGIPVLQAGGEDNGYLGRLDLNFKRENKKWVLSSYKGKLYSPYGVKNDKVIQKIIDKYEAKPLPEANLEE